MAKSAESQGSPARTRKERVAHIRLSTDEFEAIESAAAMTDLTISGFVRALSLEGAGVRPCLTEADRAVLGLLLEDMRAIGSNLNQLARALNKAGAVENDDLAASLRDVRAVVMAASSELKLIVARSGARRRGEAA